MQAAPQLVVNHQLLGNDHSSLRKGLLLLCQLVQLGDMPLLCPLRLLLVSLMLSITC